jgi:hypothetical protein
MKKLNFYLNLATQNDQYGEAFEIFHRTLHNPITNDIY